MVMDNNKKDKLDEVCYCKLLFTHKVFDRKLKIVLEEKNTRTTTQKK